MAKNEDWLDGVVEDAVRSAGPGFVEQIVKEAIAEVGDDAKGVTYTITPAPRGSTAVGIQLAGAPADVLDRVQASIAKRTDPA